MTCTRRDFLNHSALGVFGAVTVAAAACGEHTPGAPAQPPAATPALPPGTPPAFGTAPPVGPEVTVTTIAEAEKLVQVQYTAAERAQAAGNWRQAMAPLYERRTGPRKVALEPTLAPATVWNPLLPGARRHGRPRTASSAARRRRRRCRRATRTSPSRP